MAETRTAARPPGWMGLFPILMLGALAGVGFCPVVQWGGHQEQLQAAAKARRAP